MATTMNRMTVRPLSDALGAEISGIDVTDLDDAAFEALREIFLKNLVVVLTNGSALAVNLHEGASTVPDRIPRTLPFAAIDEARP